MMDGQIHAFFTGQSTHFIEALADRLPLFFCVNRFIGTEDRHIQFALDGVALFGRTDDLRAEIIQFIAVGDKVLNGHFVGFTRQQGREPCIADLQTAHIQLVFQYFRILRVFVTDFRTLETCQRHFADTLFKCVFSTQIGHIIVCPADRGNTQLYFVRIKHY